jgi:methylaspartate mutase epsilon subunit
VKKEIRNRRLTDEEFFRQRKEVMAMWPNGKEIDLNEAIEYHKSLSPSKNHALKLQKAKQNGVVSFCSMMGTAPLERDIECSRYLQDEGQSDFLSTIVDSMTRNLFFEVAERELKEIEKTGRPLLNGLPVVHYGVSGARKKITAVDLPVMLWGPASDVRLVDEIGLAGGHTGASHGGAMCAFYHYTKDQPLDICIQNFQYVYRLFGYYEERGVPVQHVAQGGLACITPPSLLFAPQIIDHLLAAEQGVQNIQFCYWGAQGSLAQAVGSIFALRKLGVEYLNRFGYNDVLTSMKAGYGTNIPFPSDYAQAFAVVCMAPIVALLSGSEVCYITTVDEAHKIPSMENNAASLKSARMMLNLLKDQESDFADSKAVKIEADMVEKETRAILDRVLDLGEGDVALGAVRAVEAGVLDQPFAASQRTARRVMGVRDAEGSIRYLSYGNLPFTNEIKDFHAEKIAEREKAQARKVDYDTVVSDIVAISRGSLLLDRDWQEKELSAVGLNGFEPGKGLF